MAPIGAYATLRILVTVKSYPSLSFKNAEGGGDGGVRLDTEKP